MTLKQLVFALVCFQISFPRIYELLIKQPDFMNWDEEFVNVITGGPHDDNKELSASLDRAMTVNEEEFDDEWEQALFKIVWLKNWQKNKITSASKMLNLINSSILSALPEKEHAANLKDAIQMSVVTSVISTEEHVFTTESETIDEKKKQLVEFWRTFNRKMAGSDTIFDTKNSKMPSTYSSWGVARNSKSDTLSKFDLNVSSSRCLRLYRKNVPSEKNIQYFNHLEANISRLAEQLDCSVDDIQFKQHDGGNKILLDFSKVIF